MNAGSDNKQPDNFDEILQEKVGNILKEKYWSKDIYIPPSNISKIILNFRYILESIFDADDIIFHISLSSYKGKRGTCKVIPYAAVG